MKNLRRIIRKLILENANHYQKLLDLFAAKELKTIRQAVELGIALEYFEEEPEKEIDDEKYWICDIVATDAFLNMFDHLYPKGISLHGNQPRTWKNWLGWILIKPSGVDASKWVLRISWPKPHNMNEGP